MASLIGSNSDQLALWDPLWLIQGRPNALAPMLIQTWAAWYLLLTQLQSVQAALLLHALCRWQAMPAQAGTITQQRWSRHTRKTIIVAPGITASSLGAGGDGRAHADTLGNQHTCPSLNTRVLGAKRMTRRFIRSFTTWVSTTHGCNQIVAMVLFCHPWGAGKHQWTTECRLKVAWKSLVFTTPCHILHV